MELTRFNSYSFDLNTSKVEQIKNKSQVDLNSIVNSSKVDRVEISSHTQSMFTKNLMMNISKISDLEQTKSTISQQMNLLTKMGETLSTTLSNISDFKTLDDIQPKIAKFIDEFNGYVGRYASVGEEEKSRTYFDGILGAKPLSSEEIFAQIDIKKNQLTQIHKVANQKILDNIEKSKVVIETEKQEYVSKQPQNTNFNFSPQQETKLEIYAPMIEVQANANLESNIKLLAS